MKIKIFKTKKNFKKGGIHQDPDIYWGLALLVAFIIVIVAIIFGFNLFRKINTELTVSEDDAVVQINTIKKDRLEKVLGYFSLRKEKSNQIIISPSPLVDPSL